MLTSFGQWIAKERTDEGNLRLPKQTNYLGCHIVTILLQKARRIILNLQN